MRGAIPRLSQYAFMVWCLVKHRDNFTFISLPLKNGYTAVQRDSKQTLYCWGRVTQFILVWSLPEQQNQWFTGCHSFLTAQNKKN